MEEICNILQGRKNYCNVEGKEEHAIFSQPQQNLIILYFKCGTDLQYPTGVEELLKCGRKSRAWFFPIQKSSTNENVEDNFISEYIQ